MSTPTTALPTPEGELARLLIDSVRDYAVFALDPQGRVLSWSAPAERLLGYREQDVLGLPAERFYTPEDVTAGVPARELRQALAAGRVEEDRWHLRRDGSRFWSGGVTTALFGDDGSLRGFAKVMRDCTAEMQARQARDEALSYASGIVETMREALLVLDGELRVQSANRAFFRGFGVAPPDTVGRLLYQLGNGQWNIARLRTLLEDILPQRSAFDDFEVEHDFPNIGRKVMLLNARRLRLADAERILLAIEDVTERRRAESERRDLETRFTSMVKNIQDHAIFTLDAQGRVTTWNLAAEHVLRFTEQEVLGRHFSFIFTPEDRARGMPESELRTAREHGRAEDERWHLRKGGERFWALGIVSALHDASGQLIGFSKILRDMTAAKHAEQLLRDSERRHRALFEAIDEGVCLIERLPVRADGLRDYRYLVMNPAMQAMFGIPDLSGQSIRDNFPNEVEDWYDDYDRVLETGQPIRFERASASQGMVLEMYVARVDNDSGHMLLAVMRDISARRRAEEALRASERRLRNVLSGMGECFGMMDHDLRIIALNEAALRLDGRPLEAIRGRTHAQAYPDANPELERLYRRALADGMPVALEHFHTGPGGGAAHWLEMRAYPVPEGLAVFWRDITERKRAEFALRAREERQAYLLRLSDGLRPLADPVDIQETAARLLGEHLRVSRALYAELQVVDGAEWVVVVREYRVTDGAGFVGRHPAAQFGRDLSALAAGRVVAVPDTEAQDTTGELHDICRTLEVRARLAVPLVKGGRLVAALAVCSQEPRPWGDQEVAIVQETAERTWAAIERARAEKAREVNETLEARVRERTRQVRDLARRLTLTELEERRRISLILHDDLQQLLYGVEMKMGQIEARLPQTVPAPLRTDLQDAHAWVAQAITSTRRLTVDLSPPILQKEGLADALVWLQRQMREMHGLEVTLQAAHGFYMPDQDLRALLFQVVRELLFNVTKHASAQRATVRLEEAGSEIVIHVIDQGEGFDVDKVVSTSDGGGGFGLFSVRERLALVGGSVVVHSQPGAGTHVEIHAPAVLHRDPAAHGAEP